MLRPNYMSNTIAVQLLPINEGGNGGGVEGDLGAENGVCCRGIANLELWGAAVKWGSEFKFNSSEECCKACKGMCSGGDGPCLCDTWVFCGNREACGSKFGEVSFNLMTVFVAFGRFWWNLFVGLIDFGF